MPSCHSKYTCNPSMKQSHARLQSCTVCMSTVRIIVTFNSSIKVLSEIHSNDQNTKQETLATIKCSNAVSDTISPLVKLVVLP